MNDPLIAKFAEACGAANPLNLRIGTADGGVLAEGSVQQPFTLIGRDEACDVTLNDPEVNPRHAWFQVVAGRVYALDLGSRTGLVWPDCAKRAGWLDVDAPVSVGPFKIQLRAPVSLTVGEPSPDPLGADPNLNRTRPLVQLDFRNGKRVKDRWTVNRAVTLVGRSEACKLHLYADDISSYHCGLVHTPIGLWVVDLSGRGVVVNGERMRVAPLTHGAELWVGRFLIGCHYPALGETPSASRPSLSSTRLAGIAKSGSPSKNGSPSRRTRVLTAIAEDEVPLGGMPTHDPLSGLPSSHIMCDAFQLSSSSGPISSPIFVTGSGPTPPQIPTPSVSRRTPAPVPNQRFVTPFATGDATLTPLLKQLSEIHGQMLDQFQESLQLVAKLFDRVPDADASALERELARIGELNAELGKLQTEVTRQSLAQLVEHSRPTANDPTPMPGLSPLGSTCRIPNTSDAIQEWVEHRIGILQTERRSRWEKLTKLVGAASLEQELVR